MAKTESCLNKSHVHDPKPSSPYTSFSKSKTLAKYLIIIFVLVVLSCFSSQVPDLFDKNPILTNLWELICLLVIGIVVCYGLFTTKIDTFSHNNDTIDGIETYLSGISHISSVFEDNRYEFDESDVYETGIRFGKYDGNKLNQYFIGESLVVINDKKFVLEQFGKPRTIKQNKPLGLPVRNLGLESIKLEDKFKETSDVDSPTPFYWPSKSMRLVNETSHFGLDFKDLKSRSMRSSMSSQMKKYSEIDESKGLETNDDLNGETSFVESKPREFCVGSSSQKVNCSSCKDIGKTKVEDVNLDSNRNVQFIKSKSQRGHSSTTKVDDCTLDSNSNRTFIKSRSQRSSVEALDYCSSFKNFVTTKVDDCTLDSNSNTTFIKSKSQRSSVEALDYRSIFKDFGSTKVDDSTLGSNRNATFTKSKSQRSSMEGLDYVLGKEEKADSSNSILKPAPVTNTYKRGKSVRTNRLKEQVLEANVEPFLSQTDDKIETISKFGTIGMNVKAEELSDTELHSSEVDRKADEFIAKFREQIRLQKVASATELNLW